MKLFYEVAIMIACAIMVSCNDNGTSSDKIFRINVEEAVDGQCRSIVLSEYVSDLDYIALETDTIFLPNYKQFDLVPTKKGFVFTPKMGRSPLYNFDVSGKFINRFSRIGRAYGEYQAVRMSHYDDISGKFTVVDINGKVLVYTLAGEFLYEIPTESLTGYIKVRDFLQLDGNIRKVSVGGTIQGETEDFVLLQITHIADYFDNIQPKERLNYLLFDKRNGTSSLMAKNNNDIHGFVNDIDNGAPFLPSKIADGKMYQIIDAASFIEFAKNSSSDKMKKVAATLTDESNPVIVVATLKH